LSDVVPDCVATWPGGPERASGPAAVPGAEVTVDGGPGDAELRGDRCHGVASGRRGVVGPGRRPRGGSSRTASGRKPGKQAGGPGKALWLVDDPDEPVGIPAPAACRCGTSLVEEPVARTPRPQARRLQPLPPPQGQRPPRPHRQPHHRAVLHPLKPAIPP